MTHGHEQSGVVAGGNGGAGWRETKGKNWDNCNSIINITYFLNLKNKVS